MDVSRLPLPATTPLLDLAREIAVACGRLITQERPAHVDVAATKSSPVDVVTIMDRRSEELATSLLRAARLQLRLSEQQLQALGELLPWPPSDTNHAPQ